MFTKLDEKIRKLLSTAIHSAGPAATVSGFRPWLGRLMTVKSLILLQNTDFGARLPQGCRNHSQNHALLCRVCRSTRASGGDIRTNALAHVSGSAPESCPHSSSTFSVSDGLTFRGQHIQSNEIWSRAMG